MIKTIILVIIGLFFLSAQHSALAQTNVKEERFEAVVTDTNTVKEVRENGETSYQKLELLITNGDRKGESVAIENRSDQSTKKQDYAAGDTLLITATTTQDTTFYYITDYVRKTPIYWLLGIFVVLTLLIGRLRGALSLIGMSISFLVIFFFVLPLIIRGIDPVLTAIAGSLIIIPTTFYLSHGVNRKTTAAVIATLGSLIITGILAMIATDAAKLTGFTSDEANFLEAARQGGVNMKGLLLAGIIIGTLGILDDITISQAAIAAQLKKTDPKLPFQKLYFRTMDVGRDHIASVVNTLILVYTGAALPLFLLFTTNAVSLQDVISYEIIAEEIIRTLVASIGLILAVPIATFTACLLLQKQKE
jgi:uncharacterized membrane protein